MKSTDLWNWVFEFILVRPEMLTSASIVCIQILLDFIPSNFSLLFIELVLIKPSVNFVTFI